MASSTDSLVLKDPRTPQIDRQQANELVKEIQGLFSSVLHISVDSATADLFQAGALDSMGLVELIFHLEQRFGLHLPAETLDLESFRSVSKIAELVTKQHALAGLR
jgi:acyl carrier protein